MKRRILLLNLVGIMLTACGATTPETSQAEIIQEAVSNEATSVESMQENGNAQSFDESTQEVTEVTNDETVNLDDYVGYYSDGENDVTIEKDGYDYSMTVGLFRLTTLSEGTVTALNDGVLFDTFDANEEPMKVSFRKDSSENFTLTIEESTWPLLESGTVFENMAKTEKVEEPDNVDSTSLMKDGVYYTELLTEPDKFRKDILKSFEYEEGLVFVEASYIYYTDEDLQNREDLDSSTLVFQTDSNTMFMAAGGEGISNEYMTGEQFNDYVNSLMGTGLSLRIVVKDGVAVDFRIIS